MKFIGCQKVHFVNSLIGVGIYGFFSALGHMDIVVNIDGLRMTGWLKRDGRGSVPILNPLISEPYFSIPLRDTDDY